MTKFGKQPSSSPDYNRMERKEAAKDGASLVSNSGRGWDKGDATWNEFLVDYKFNAKSFTLNLKNWLKHKKDSWGSDNKEPMVIVKFEDGTKVAIIDWNYFSEVYESAWKYEDLNE